MNLIFCLSYLSLWHTLFLIEKHGVKNVIVITSNKSLVKLFKILYKEDIVYFSNSLSLTLPNKIHHFILFPFRVLELLIKKRKSWKFFKKYKNCNIYFFFNTAGFFHAWIINKLSANNKLYYLSDLNIDNLDLKKSIFTFLNQVFIKFFYSVEVEAFDLKFDVTYKMTSKFFNKSNVENLNISYNTDHIISNVQKKLKLSKGDILFLQPILKEQSLDDKFYTIITDEIIAMLLDNNYKTHLKIHPRSRQKYSLENKLIEVPKFYPANVIPIHKISLGISSAALYEIANLGGCSISLIKIYFKERNDIISSRMKFLNNNLNKHKKIFFPEDFDELKKIIFTHLK